MVSNCIGTNVFASINKIWTVCSLLTQWQNPILKSNENKISGYNCNSYHCLEKSEARSTVWIHSKGHSKW
ncbi:hypothetical protein KUTeg_023895 [Tegillarca granosa]|uniref:Uncharacterized protein n=1 Tax=Tegillarca granosa TaxID=220873 RepID=A0ABQ9DZV6_TEGGR|nr:hypothetical protein KUTeg_023895 [Tegillarca granosa]